MRLRRNRGPTGRNIETIGVGMFGFALTGNDILTITQVEDLPLVTTAAPHGLGDGGDIQISGTSVSAYNTTYGVSYPGRSYNVVSATKFSLVSEDFEPYPGNATGGQWGLP